MLRSYFLTPLAASRRMLVVAVMGARGMRTIDGGLMMADTKVNGHHNGEENGCCHLPPVEDGTGNSTRKYSSRKLIDCGADKTDPDSVLLMKARRSLWRLKSLPEEIKDPCCDEEVMLWYKGKLTAKANRKAKREGEKEAVVKRRVIRLGRLALRQLDVGSLRPRELVAKAPRLRTLLAPGTLPCLTAEDDEIYEWYEKVCEALSPDDRTGNGSTRGQEEKADALASAA
mmetsp:Transcript_16887/g.14356  ORF Transcript_16887/g.14356 Transcript_16887/m.14356 type:complete len:229 (+) Transcript_16887:35-721(+)